MASASTIDKELKAEVKHGGNVESAKMVGKKLAERAAAKGIETVVFDRAGYKYTGRIQALADAVITSYSIHYTKLYEIIQNSS